MYWVMGLLPFALLLLGFPIFLLLLITSLVDVPYLFRRADDSRPSNHLQQPRQISAAGRSVLCFRRRPDVARRPLGAADALGGVDVRRVPGEHSADLARFCRLFGAISGITTAVAAARHVDLSAHARGRLQREFASALITAEGALDNLIPPSIAMIIYGIASDTSVIRLFAAGIGPGLLLAGFSASTSTGTRSGTAYRLRQILVQGVLAGDARRSLGTRRDRHDLRRHLFRRVLADRGGRRLLRLRDFRQLFVYREGRFEDLRDRRARDVPDRHDFHHRIGRRPLCLAADHQRHRQDTVDDDHRLTASAG